MWIQVFIWNQSRSPILHEISTLCNLQSYRIRLRHWWCIENANKKMDSFFCSCISRLHSPFLHLCCVLTGIPSSFSPFFLFFCHNFFLPFNPHVLHLSPFSLFLFVFLSSFLGVSFSLFLSPSFPIPPKILFFPFSLSISCFLSFSVSFPLSPFSSSLTSKCLVPLKRHCLSITVSSYSVVAINTVLVYIIEPICLTSVDAGIPADILASVQCINITNHSSFCNSHVLAFWETLCQVPLNTSCFLLMRNTT